MSTLALVINANQNAVSKSEIAKIKKEVAKNTDSKISIYANDKAFNPIDTDYKEDRCVVFNTKDSNNKVSAKLVFGQLDGVYEIEL